MDLYHVLFAVNPRVVWPGFLALVVAALALVAIKLWRPRPQPLFLNRLAYLGSAVLLACAVGQFVLAGIYLFYPSYYDHMEANTVVQSWLGWRGLPLYPSPETGDVYAFPYGPALFQTVGLFLRIFGPSIAASKIPALLAFGTTQILSCTLLRRGGATTLEALTITAAQCFVLSAFGDQGYIYGPRADPFLFLIAEAAMLATTSGPTIGNAVVLGLLGGLESNLKIHGALYIVPAAVYFLWTCRGLGERVRLGGLGAAAGLVALALPFLPGNVSFPEYLHYFWVLRQHPLSRWIFEQNVAFAAMCLLPFVWFRFSLGQRLPRGMALFFASVAVCMAITSFVASEEGGGPHHLLPFLPSVAWAYFVQKTASSNGAHGWTRDGVPAAIGAGLIFTLVVGYGPLVAVSWERTFQDLADAGELRQGIAEIDQAMAENPGITVAVGPGDSPIDAQRLRVIPVFRGNPLPVDSSAWMEFRVDGVSDASVRQSLKSCRVGLWLLPKGAPFRMTSLLGAKDEGELFSPAVRADFQASYTEVGSGRIFDEWKCRSRG